MLNYGLCDVAPIRGLFHNRFPQEVDPPCKLRTTTARTGCWHHKGTRRRRDSSNFRTLQPATVEVGPWSRKSPCTHNGFTSHEGYCWFSNVAPLLFAKCLNFLGESLSHSHEQSGIAQRHLSKRSRSSPPS